MHELLMPDPVTWHAVAGISVAVLVAVGYVVLVVSWIRGR